MHCIGMRRVFGRKEKYNNAEPRSSQQQIKHNKNTLSLASALPSMEFMCCPTLDDASPRLGGGGPGAFFLPNTRFMLLYSSSSCNRVIVLLSRVESIGIRSCAMCDASSMLYSVYFLLMLSAITISCYRCPAAPAVLGAPAKRYRGNRQKAVK